MYALTPIKVYALDRVYEDFTAKVADGRGLSREKVAQIVEGGRQRYGPTRQALEQLGGAIDAWLNRAGRSA